MEGPFGRIPKTVFSYSMRSLGGGPGTFFLQCICVKKKEDNKPNTKKHKRNKNKHKQTNACCVFFCICRGPFGGVPKQFFPILYVASGEALRHSFYNVLVHGLVGDTPCVKQRAYTSPGRTRAKEKETNFPRSLRQAKTN